MENKFRKYIRAIARLNLKTIYFNFKYLTFNQAIRFPFLISRKAYFREISGEVILKSPAKFGMIEIGFGRVGIFDEKISRTIWEVAGQVIFHGSADIGHGSKISVGSSGTLIIGDNFRISAETAIVAFTKIEFGQNCLLSWDTLIMDTDFHKIKNKEGDIINSPKPIIVGDHVWVGCRNLILKGSKIPNNSIIAANSILSKTLLKENCLYGGAPIKCLKEDVSWGP